MLLGACQTTAPSSSHYSAGGEIENELASGSGSRLVSACPHWRSEAAISEMLSWVNERADQMQRSVRVTGTDVNSEDHAVKKQFVSKTPAWEAAVGFAAVLGLAILPYPAHAASGSGSDTVQNLYEALLNTMKNGRTLGQSGRFAQLEPVIRRTFDISSMARLSVGSSWPSLTEAQRQQVTESFGRYIAAIYADRFDNYAGQKLQVTSEQPAASGLMVRSQIVKAS